MELDLVLRDAIGQARRVETNLAHRRARARTAAVFPAERIGERGPDSQSERPMLAAPSPGLYGRGPAVSITYDGGQVGEFEPA
jgi:hypothetical protein